MKKHTFYLISLCLITCYTPNLYSQIVINEVYADVAVSLIGDANGDGIRSAREDEFIELFNQDSLPVDLSGFQLIIAQTVKHEFEEGTMIPPKSFLVIFGGGKPNGLFGESPILLASSGSLGLSNSGTSILLQTADSLLIDRLSYNETNVDASLVRTPEFTGDFIPHTERPDAFGLPFSPGTLTNSFPYNNGDTTLIHFTVNRGIAIESDGKIDLYLNLINPKPADVIATIELTGGTGDSMDLANFTSKTIIFPINSNSQRQLTIPIADDAEIEGQETFIFTIIEINSPDNNQISINQSFELTIFDDDNDFGLVLTEFLADPPSGLIGDTNGDGERNASQDEFLEFLNISDQAIDLSGIAIYDTDLLRHQFPDSTIIQPNQLLLIFGGGEIENDFEEAIIIQKASSGRLSLTNTGDRIMLRDSLQNILLLHDYGATANNDQAMVLCPIEKEGTFANHTAIGAGSSFSPGTLHDCIPFTVSLQNLHGDAIKVYPNPTNSQLFIELPTALQLVLPMELVNLQGQVVLMSYATVLSVCTLPEGSYFLKINTTSGIIVKKIIVN